MDCSQLPEKKEENLENFGQNEIMTPEQARGIPKPKFQKDISTPTEPEKKFKRKRNDISSELKGMINETLKFSKREEEARATALLKTRTLEAHQAEVLMNISPLFGALHTN